MTKAKEGSVFGGILLIVGSCIGAGMLALPILTGISGFFPSLITLFSSFFFMTFTALLLVEINSWFTTRVNIVSMAERTLGNWGRLLSWVTYLFLFYALLIAYVSISGSVGSSLFASSFIIPKEAVSTCFTLVFGLLIYLGTRSVDLFNRILVIGLILSYIGLISLGIGKIDSSLLLYSNSFYILVPLPVLITSFGFHNMIPTLHHYLQGNLSKIRLTVIGGSFCTLLIYLLWDIYVLGVVPVAGESGLMTAYLSGKEATETLRNHVPHPSLTAFADSFALFSIITSFLAQGLALMHFLADGCKIIHLHPHRWWLTLLTLLPPFIFALFYPGIFIQALGFAGGICAVILFGILPALMAYKGRYQEKIVSSYQVKGGKLSLLAVILFSLFILACEVMQILKVSFYNQG